jgi:hypothetical protein
MCLRRDVTPATGRRITGVFASAVVPFFVRPTSISAASRQLDLLCSTQRLRDTLYADIHHAGSSGLLQWKAECTPECCIKLDAICPTATVA